METLFFLLDTVALAILVFQSIKDERAGLTNEMTGLFRFKFDKRDPDATGKETSRDA